VCFERGFLREFVPWPAVNAAEDWLGYVQCGVCIIGSLLYDLLLSGDWVLMCWNGRGSGSKISNSMK
jgi:hypothetical protein